MRRLRISALTTMALLSFPLPSRAQSAITTTVCALVEHRGSFNRKFVRVQGRVLSDGIEHTVLVDTACPDRGIGLWIPDSKIEKGDVAELFSAIYRRGYAGTRRKVITGRFVGTYYWAKKGTPRYILKLERVEDLHIRLETSAKQENIRTN